MEVADEEDFDYFAREYIYKCVNARGDEFKCMDDINLLNTIGMALDKQIILATTEEEKELTDEGRFFMFSKDDEKHIRKVFDAIKNETVSTAEIKLIPLAVYTDKKMYQIPLFNILRPDGTKYVDNVGRVYKSYEDWKENNFLPAGRLACPKFLKMDENFMVAFMNTPESRLSRKLWSVVDGVSCIVGTGLLVFSVFPACVIPGSQFIIIAVLGYGIIRSSYALHDRKTHGQSISLLDSTARRHWLSIASSGLNILSIGVLYQISSMAYKGAEFSKAVCTSINILNGTNLTLNAATALNNTVYVISNWKEIPTSQKIFIFAHIAFLTLSAMSFKNADQLIANFRQKAISDMVKDMSPEAVKKVDILRVKLGDQGLLNNINNKVQSLGISHELALDSIVNGLQRPSDFGQITHITTTSYVGICIDALTQFGTDKLNEMYKNGELVHILPIMDSFPDYVLDYASQVVNKMQPQWESGDYVKCLTGILGLIFSAFKTTLSTDELIGETRPKHETDFTNENFGTACKQLGITDKSNANEKIWKGVLEKLNQKKVSDLYKFIKNFCSLNEMVGSYPIRHNSTNDRLLRESEELTEGSLTTIIEHGKILFGSEPAAIFNFITEGLAKNQTSLNKYINDANEFICKDNFIKPWKFKDGYRFCY